GRRDAIEISTWGRGSSATLGVRAAEHPTECRVSDYIRGMPFLWLDVSQGRDGSRSMRARIEANSIALLSNRRQRDIDETIDPPSERWLGRHSAHEEIQTSGLWNVHHVDEDYDHAFLDDLLQLIRAS